MTSSTSDSETSVLQLAFNKEWPVLLGALGRAQDANAVARILKALAQKPVVKNIMTVLSVKDIRDAVIFAVDDDGSVDMIITALYMQYLYSEGPTCNWWHGLEIKAARKVYGPDLDTAFRETQPSGRALTPDEVDQLARMYSGEQRARKLLAVVIPQDLQPAWPEDMAAKGWWTTVSDCLQAAALKSPATDLIRSAVGHTPSSRILRYFLSERTQRY